MDDAATRDSLSPRARATTPLARVGLVALLVLALLVVVALASSASAPFGGASDEARPPSRTLLDYALTIALFVVVGMMAGIAYLLRPTGRWKETEGRAPSHLLPLLIALTIFVGIFIVFAVVFGGDVTGRTLSPQDRAVGTTRADAPSVEPTPTPYEPEFRWPVVIAVAALVAAALVAAAVARSRRRKVAASTPLEFVAELTSLIDIALDDLRAEADPRRAVIAAYARMERALAAFGLPRRAFEAPYEYLDRIEPRLADDLPAAGELVAALTALFERAKFSPHEIEASMRDEAVATLTALRDDLVARQEEQHDAAVV